MVIHSQLKKIQGASERMGSMYLCLPTSIRKGVSERPRIRRAEILLVNESNSVMTEYARVTFSTVALMMSSLELTVKSPSSLPPGGKEHTGKKKRSSE
uniref:LUC7 like 2, pre-mRNA splicing factor n=1 Tax=Equus asinus TaxID=9793 RepID=A0A8C4LPB8_EQUAS